MYNGGEVERPAPKGRLDRDGGVEGGENNRITGKFSKLPVYILPAIYTPS